jgi:hypothetical protein
MFKNKGLHIFFFGKILFVFKLDIFNNKGNSVLHGILNRFASKIKRLKFL